MGWAQVEWNPWHLPVFHTGNWWRGPCWLQPPRNLNTGGGGLRFLICWYCLWGSQGCWLWGGWGVWAGQRGHFTYWKAPHCCSQDVIYASYEPWLANSRWLFIIGAAADVDGVGGVGGGGGDGDGHTETFVLVTLVLSFIEIQHHCGGSVERLWNLSWHSLTLTWEHSHGSKYRPSCTIDILGNCSYRFAGFTGHSQPINPPFFSLCLLSMLYDGYHCTCCVLCAFGSQGMTYGRTSQFQYLSIWELSLQAAANPICQIWFCALSASASNVPI